MRIDLFDFDLPDDRIALRPAVPRDAARMLVVRPGAEPELDDRGVADLPALLAPGDVLVVNDTRVIPARLAGTRSRDGATARIEATLIERAAPDRWVALARPGKRLAVGDRIRFGGSGDVCLLGALDATVAAKGEDGAVTLAFDLAGPDLDFAIAAAGLMPLPPYIAGRRPVDRRDDQDYQTMFARDPGAVAAPTAGLHLTPALVERLEVRGIGIVPVTLHVGGGTFLPVKADDTDDHRMHAEWGFVSAEAAGRINAARGRGGRVVAVGTTALRLLESAAAPDGTLRPFAGSTDIFIVPGHRFRAVDALMTNFHLPRSTLVVLVAAFAGLDVMHRAYAHAVAAGYRFYSYGDSGLWFRPPGAA